MVVYTVAVGTQDNTLLYFFHSQRVPPVAHEGVNAAGLGAGVFVVKIQRGCVAEPAIGAGQRSLKGFPLFSQGRPFFLGALLSFFFCFLGFLWSGSLWVGLAPRTDNAKSCRAMSRNLGWHLGRATGEVSTRLLTLRLTLVPNLLLTLSLSLS